MTNALETIRNIEQSLLIPSTTKKKKEGLSFHLKHHGKNIEVSADGKRASRINPTQQFNHAVLFSNRPLEDNEVFMVEVGSVISSWVGSIEMGKIKTSISKNVKVSKNVVGCYCCGWLSHHHKRFL